MKVSELIDKLKELPQDHEVWIMSDNDNCSNRPLYDIRVCKGHHAEIIALTLD